MIPQYPTFRNITLEDKADIDALLAAYPPYSDYNFTSLWCWDTGEKVQISQFEDHLVIRFSDYITNELFYSILGTKKTKEIITLIFEQCRKEGKPAEIRLVPESVVSSTGGVLETEFDVIEDHDNHDYIISIPGLLKLEGSTHKDNRYFIRFFEQHHPTVQVRILDVSDATVQNAILTLDDDWAAYAGGVEENHDHEHRAIQRHFVFANKYPGTVNFMGLYEGDALIAFGSFEVIDTEYALAHFQKALRQYKGIYQYLWHHILKEMEAKGIQYLNFEQDLGIPELRKAKQGMRPIKHLKKYIIRQKSEKLV